jgi:exonuclease VII large subunit
MARSRALDREFERAKSQLSAAVEGEARTRTGEIERTIARARADSLSAYAEEERRLAETRRSALEESEERLRHGLAQAFAKVQGQVEQRLASWHQDLDRAQRGLGEQLERVAQRERSLIEALEARLENDADRLQAVDEEQRAIVVRLREDLARAIAESAAAAEAELESHATERRRALHQVADRMTTRERDLIRRVEREETDASRRIQSSFGEVERRQVEQLERVLERTAASFADAATHQFDGTIRAAREEAARRLQRELERAVQRFAREGDALLAERMTKLGESGGLRFEKKLGQVSEGLERERDEFVAALSQRLGEVEAGFRERLSALASEERALEERLTELTGRIERTISRAEQQLDALQGLPR